MKCRARALTGAPARTLRKQRGVAMVIAMLVFALSTALVVAMSSEFTLVMRKGSNVFIGQKAAAYLRGGEDLAGLVLRQDREQDREADSLRDHLEEAWAQQVPPYALDEGGWLAGRLVDLQGRFNLNDLDGRAPEGKRFTPAQEQFIRLLQTPEEPRISEQDAILITESILDWMDRDGDPRDYGAEDDYYFDQTPSYRSANREFASVSELRVVAYMTPELYAAVAPSLTVWGSGGKVNIHTADIPLLRSINSAGDLQPLSLAEGEALFEFAIGPMIGGATENWFAYVLALVFLVFRPQGLFGEKIIERV